MDIIDLELNAVNKLSSFATDADGQNAASTLGPMLQNISETFLDTTHGIDFNETEFERVKGDVREMASMRCNFLPVIARLISSAANAVSLNAISFPDGPANCPLEVLGNAASYPQLPAE